MVKSNKPGSIKGVLREGSIGREKGELKTNKVGLSQFSGSGSPGKGRPQSIG
jgi:hypothetical protein